MTPRPIEIVGGGLAGLSLGLALRRAAVPVSVIEAGQYPRHRVCGEFITGLGPATIARLGLETILADARQHRRVTWFVEGVASRAQTLPSPALGISRHRLDARLAEAFVAAGGLLHTGARAAALPPAPGRIIATGRRRARSEWIGLKIHATHLPLASDLELHLGDNAYVGLAPVENDRVNVCGLFRRDALPRGSRADANTAENPPSPAAIDTGARHALLFAHLRAARLDALAERLADAPLDAASFCAVAAVAFDRRVSVRPEAGIGDACAMIPPFTGNGMAMAFQSAEVTLDPLLAYATGRTTWSDATATIHRALRRRFRTRLASAGAIHSYLLRPARQRWLAALTRARLLPLRPLYAALH